MYRRILSSHFSNFLSTVVGHSLYFPLCCPDESSSSFGAVGYLNEKLFLLVKNWDSVPGGLGLGTLYYLMETSESCKVTLFPE